MVFVHLRQAFGGQAGGQAVVVNRGRAPALTVAVVCLAEVLSTVQYPRVPS